jgi:prepilin-type processing-associated H-X9-DG protein
MPPWNYSQSPGDGTPSGYRQLGNTPMNGLFGWNYPRAIANVLDGMSNTLMFGEFVHADMLPASPGNWPEATGGAVRPWLPGGSSDEATRLVKKPIANFDFIDFFGVNPSSSQGTSSGSFAFKSVNGCRPNAVVNGSLTPGSDVTLAYFNHLPFGSHHAAGANFAFGDGRVTFIDDTIDFPLYKDLASCNGTEVKPLDTNLVGSLP